MHGNISGTVVGGDAPQPIVIDSCTMLACANAYPHSHAHIAQPAGMHK